MIRTVVVCGAGTMGSGIAQISAMSGYPTLLFDISSSALQKAATAIEQQLSQLVIKNRINPQQKNETLHRLTFSAELQQCCGDIIIEAVAEKTEVKVDLFRQIADVNKGKVIFATNTSSLSVTTIAESSGLEENTCGLHFFNPAPVMKLVEIVKTIYTKTAVVEEVTAFARSLQKIPVVCADSPGFIVNRVARHYYLESLKMAEEKIASFEDIDELLESAGFKMGPFRLMDLIGNDVNLAVTKSIYEAFGKAIRFTPSVIQENKVKDGALGKKTGRGYYNY